jgi:thiol-disulfide isomerase/thioredoxin
MRILRVLIVSGLAAFAADLPRKCPDFAINLLDGNHLPLSDYHGKIVALAFIHTTCPHCQVFTQTLNAIQKDYAPRGVQVLESAFNENARILLPGFIQQYKPSFPAGWNDFPGVLAFMQISILKGPGYVPKIVFIDRNGAIQKQFEGQDDFFRDPDRNTRAALDELLKAPPLAHKKTAARSH